MRNIYDALNNTGIKAEDYTVKEPVCGIEKAAMKRNFKKSVKKYRRHSPARWAAAAACAVCAVGFSQTAFAKTLVDNIIKSVDVGGGIFIVQDDTSKPVSAPQFYDKKGNKISLSSNGSPTDIYDKSGKYLGCIGSSKEGDTAAGTIQEKDLNSALKQLNFKALTSDKVPDGYSFDYASLYLDDSGKPSGDYIDIYYKKGQEQIFIQERRLSEETAYTAGTDGTVQETSVNGHKAALENGHSLTWNAGNVNIYVSAQNVTDNELMDFAESMK